MCKRHLSSVMHLWLCLVMPLWKAGTYTIFRTTKVIRNRRPICSLSLIPKAVYSSWVTKSLPALRAKHTLSLVMRFIPRPSIQERPNWRIKRVVQSVARCRQGSNQKSIQRRHGSAERTYSNVTVVIVSMSEGTHWIHLKLQLNRALTLRVRPSQKLPAKGCVAMIEARKH